MTNFLGRREDMGRRLCGRDGVTQLQAKRCRGPQKLEKAGRIYL
jgi:hypothetical protein